MIRLHTCSGLNDDHNRQELSKANSKSSVKRSSTLMKPTASHLAKQNQLLYSIRSFNFFSYNENLFVWMLHYDIIRPNEFVDLSLAIYYSLHTSEAFSVSFNAGPSVDLIIFFALSLFWSLLPF